MAAEFELEYLLLEGHCFDVTTGQPPRGLQFTLGTASDPVIVDTIVMANLVSHNFNQENNRLFGPGVYAYCDVSLQGYFQLKANPGAWVLRLRKGRSDDIYKIYRYPVRARQIFVFFSTLSVGLLIGWSIFFFFSQS